MKTIHIILSIILILTVLFLLVTCTTGFKKIIDMKVLDVEYVRHQFFIVPDIGIDENTLLLYKTTTGTADVVVDGKIFTLLNNGSDYTFDNTRARIYLLNALLSSEELIVYYEKVGLSVGDVTLGQNAIIDTSGNRDDFNNVNYPEYFTGSSTYLYLQKKNFNSYWELRNGYFLDEYEGEALFNVNIELLATANNEINGNYDDLLDQYEVNTNAEVIFFNFEDLVGFYPRPFPGPEPYPVYNPFDPANLIYGGLGDPLPENSINTIRIQYEY